MGRHIRIVTPIVVDLFSDAALAPYQREGLRLSHRRLNQGPASVESQFDEALAQPDTLRCIRAAEQEGCDAVVINCLGDPAMEAGREIVNIPVLGPCQSSMHMATLLGNNFGIVSVLENVRLLIEHLASKYGLHERYVGFDYVSIPVLELEKEMDRLVSMLTDKSERLVRERDANVIILGCTGMLGCARGIRANLLERGIDVPVVDPLLAAISTAVAVLDSGLAHSRRAYQTPPAKEIQGFDWVR